MNIQHCADSGNVHGMYEGMKVAFRPCISKVAALKSRAGEVISDCSKMMEWWAAHYMNMYSTENIISYTALDNTPALPTMVE